MTQPTNTLKQHVRDAAGASAASLLATGVDGLVFVALLSVAGAERVALSAGAAALFGGVVHYAASRFWVFRRFEAPILRSVVTYFAMSWLAALLHALVTGWLAALVGVAGAWGLSKLFVWLAWTYPASRFVVFGGLAGAGPGPGTAEVEPQVAPARVRDDAS